MTETEPGTSIRFHGGDHDGQELTFSGPPLAATLKVAKTPDSTVFLRYRWDGTHDNDGRRRYHYDTEAGAT